MWKEKKRKEELGLGELDELPEEERAKLGSDEIKARLLRNKEEEAEKELEKKKENEATVLNKKKIEREDVEVAAATEVVAEARERPPAFGDGRLGVHHCRHRPSIVFGAAMVSRLPMASGKEPSSSK